MYQIDSVYFIFLKNSEKLQRFKYILEKSLSKNVSSSPTGKNFGQYFWLTKANVNKNDEADGLLSGVVHVHRERQKQKK